MKYLKSFWNFKAGFFLVIFILIPVINILAQSNNTEKVNLKRTLNFDNWEGADKDRINGINLSKEKLNTLFEAKEIKPAYLFFISYQKNGAPFVKYRSKWWMTDNSFIEITMSFLNSSFDAHENVIDELISTTLPLNIIQKSMDYPCQVGDLSFYNARIFVRNNIVVKIHAEGKFVIRIKDIAKEVDSLLLQEKPTKSELKPYIITDTNGSYKIIEP